MSYADFETSLQNGRPIRLYQFQRGPLKWGYSNVNRTIQFQGITFKAVEGGIEDDGIRQTLDAQSDSLNLTTSATLDVVQMYRVVAPSQTISLTIFDSHYGETDYLVVWVGQIAGVKFKDSYSAQIQCRTLSSTLDRTGLRKTWSKNCPHTLYDNACKVERSAFKNVGVIDSLNGVNIGFAQAASQEDGYFSGGYIEWVGQYGLEQRGIEKHTHDQLTLFGGTFGLALNQEISVYAGCNRTLKACNEQFNNVPNYGGNPYMPGKSPFDGTPVF